MRRVQHSITMGQIIHEMRRSESETNFKNLKPYQPRTAVISNVRDAVAFQIRYESEWYAAIVIQRAWRAVQAKCERRRRRMENARLKNEMRLKYGHIAGFVLRRDAAKSQKFLGMRSCC